MSQVISTHYSKRTKSHDDFLSRLRKNLIKEVVVVSKIVRIAFGLIFAISLGIMLFLSEFDIVKKFFALAFLPVVIFLIGKYLTLLPMYLVMGIALMSILSLASSEEGDNLVSWISGMMSSLSEGLSGSSPTTTSLTQKLLGFVTLSAVASFFIVYLV